MPVEAEGSASLCLHGWLRTKPTTSGGSTCWAYREHSVHLIHRFLAAEVTTQLWPACAFAPWVAARSLCLLLADGLAFLPATGVASNLASLNRGTGSWARICAHLWPKRGLYNQCVGLAGAKKLRRSFGCRPNLPQGWWPTSTSSQVQTFGSAG